MMDEIIENNIKGNSKNIFTKYVNVINNYLMLFSNSTKFLKGDRDNIYLLIKGIDTITHVFKISLWNNQSIEMVLENAQNSIYFYTQFIEQMEENILFDLNLTSNNASIFVYKKTILMLNFETKMQNDTNKNILKNIEILIQIYKNIFEILIETHKNDINTVINKITSIANDLCDHTANATDSDHNNIFENETEYKKELNNISLFINHLRLNKKIDIYEYIKLYIKKYKKCNLTDKSIIIKTANNDYNNILETLNINKYIKWLIA